MVVWFLALMALGAAVLAAPGWVPLRVEHGWVIAGMGLAGAFGQIALTQAFLRGEASMIAPLEYTGLVWVIGWDWLLLADAARHLDLDRGGDHRRQRPLFVAARAGAPGATPPPARPSLIVEARCFRTKKE